MTNMGLISESTGNNYKKVENMWSDLSDVTRSFTNINKTDRNDTEGETRTQLIISLNVLISWMISQPKTVLDGKKNIL